MNNQSFEIRYPTGYQVTDVHNDNIDIHVIVNDKVYFATLFTLENISHLMKKDKESWFWATDMVIVSDLSASTIEVSIATMIESGYLEEALTEIPKY